MKIAILAPESMGNYILETAQKYFSDIEILLLVYNDYKECVKLLQKNKKKSTDFLLKLLAIHLCIRYT